MSNIGVIVVDDQPIVRSGLIMAINEEPGMEVVGEAKDGNEAVEKAREHSPDLVLIDVELPDMSGMDTIRQILMGNPDVRILVFSAFNNEEFIIKAFDAGAMGYVLKGSGLEEILESIRKVHSGEEVISPGIAKTMVQGALKRMRSGPGPSDMLSERELEVIGMTSNGSTVPEVSEKLELSPNTVRTYQQRAMRKLDLHSQSELFKYAVRHKIIEVD